MLWLGLRASPADLRELMQAIDQNNDDVVSSEEFVQALGGPLDLDDDVPEDTTGLEELDR